ncbi:MAG: F0F1 ATP synthase subunit A [Rhodocyclaceae bacterium]|jgi:F-type H+-transporting ATPase subunit a|nr:F0F1 ATP synthase subunit A [Rhodocyclaceae bacterium]
MASSSSFITEVFHIGPLFITNTVIVTWGIMLALTAAAWTVTRGIRLRPGRWQVVVEGIVAAIEDAVRTVLPDHYRQVMPFIATLWIFIAAANLVSLIPGLRSPTGDLSLTAGLAILVFLAVHWYGLRSHGLKSYLRHYLQPNPILLPFHLISEITRTVALAVRLFGNIFSLQMAALLVLLVAGFLAPVPVLMLHIIEAVVQAYIFGMLALIYVAGAIQSQQLKHSQEKE